MSIRKRIIAAKTSKTKEQADEKFKGSLTSPPETSRVSKNQ